MNTRFPGRFRPPLLRVGERAVRIVGVGDIELTNSALILRGRRSVGTLAAVVLVILAGIVSIPIVVTALYYMGIDAETAGEYSFYTSWVAGALAAIALPRPAWGRRQHEVAIPYAAIESIRVTARNRKLLTFTVWNHEPRGAVYFVGKGPAVDLDTAITAKRRALSPQG